MKKISFYFLILIAYHQAFAQCDSTFLRPTGTSVYDVSFITDNKIIGVGYNGYIIKSENGGKRWRNIHTLDAGGTLRTVAFVNDSIGFATGESGIIKTEDQGENWFPLPFPPDPHYQIKYYNMHFFTKDRGIFVGSYGHVLSTADGGRNFKDTTIGSDDFYSIDFVDDSTGLIAGSDVYKTTDGGKTWRNINIDNLGPSYIRKTIRKIKYITPQFAVLTGDFNFAATSSDGGETWTAGTPNFNIGNINDFYFFDSKNAIAIGNNSTGTFFLHTSDGAKTFTSSIEDFLDAYLFTINVNPSKNILLATGGSTINSLSNGRAIVKSVDNGTSWTSLSNNREVDYNYSQFLNDSVGFIAGADVNFYKTNDYGESWVKQGQAITNFGNGVQTFYFSDTLHGYAVTEALSSTSDGGKTWSARSLLGASNSDAPQHMVFLDSLTGVASFRNSIYYTIDGAISWQSSQMPVNNDPWNVTGITRTPSGKIFASGDNGNVMESVDSGKTWTLNNTINDYLVSIYFYNNAMGFIGTSDSVIYKTIDGGITWNKIITISHGARLRSFAFMDSLHGYMLANNGYAWSSEIYFSKDGGYSWAGLYGQTVSIYQLSGFNTVYAAGGDGVILKTDHLVKPSVTGYIAGPTSVCNNSLSIYSVAKSNKVDYTWVTIPSASENYAGNTDTIQWNNIGRYMVSVAAGNVCGVGPQRTLTVNVSDFKPVITVKDTLLVVTEGVYYKWYLNDTLIKSGNADTARILVPVKSGIYKSEVENKMGCLGTTDTVQYTMPLPFRLINFSGVLLSDKIVTLQWTVANERYNLFEVIERGVDSIHFNPIDSLQARNNFNIEDTYVYKDYKAGSGINVYRIEFKDRNGRVSYSPIVKVRGSVDSAPLIYPNPAKTFVTVYKGAEEIYSVSIYDKWGSLVFAKQFQSGQVSVGINVSNLQNGIYVLKIKTAQNVYTQQLIIIR